MKSNIPSHCSVPKSAFEKKKGELSLKHCWRKGQDNPGKEGGFSQNQKHLTHIHSPSFFSFYFKFFPLFICVLSPRGKLEADTASTQFKLFFLPSSLSPTHLTLCLAARRLGHTWRQIWTIAFDSYRVCLCQLSLIQRFLIKICIIQVPPGIESSYRCPSWPSSEGHLKFGSHSPAKPFSCRVWGMLLCSSQPQAHLWSVHHQNWCKCPKPVKNVPWNWVDDSPPPFYLFSFLVLGPWSALAHHHQTCARRGNESFAVGDLDCRILILKKKRAHLQEPGGGKKILANSSTSRQDFFGVSIKTSFLLIIIFLTKK